MARTVTLAVCVAEPEAEWLRAAAKRACLPMSQYLHTLIESAWGDKPPLPPPREAPKRREAPKFRLAPQSVSVGRAAMPPRSVRVTASRFDGMSSAELTREMLGDPPPGRSALDQRK
jgi:hypothetical protein